MKRKIAILLIFCMAITAFVACADKTGDDDDLPDIVGKDQIEYLDAIPDDYNLEGLQVGVMYGFHVEDQVIGEEEDLDIVYTTIYERNIKVETRLNCDINFISTGGTAWTDVSPILRQYITTMDDSFQIVISTNNSVIQDGIYNMFHNLNDSAYIDIGADWWYEDAIMECSIDYYYYRFLFGDISLSAMGNNGAIYYNKDLYSQYVDPGNPDGPYQEVLNGTWTFEKLALAVKNSFVDLGGENNIYGYTLIRYAEPLHYFPVSCGIEFYERDPSGKPIVTVYSDKAVEFTNDLYDLLYNNEGANLYYPNQIDAESGKPMFTDGKYVFSFSSIMGMVDEEMREMEATYGVLPYPKWDAAQENYITMNANGSVLVGCSKNADIDFVNEEVSAVIEALASESHTSVLPAFYERAMQKAYSRDDTTSQMIDIICGKDDEISSIVTKNWLYEYSWHTGNVMGKIFQNIMAKGAVGAPNFTSVYESNIETTNTLIQTLWDEYLKDAMSE